MATKLALGTAQLGLDYGVANRGGKPSAASADRILAAAKEHGVAMIDTAPAYGDAESIVGRFTAEQRWDVAVCTKLGALSPQLPYDTLALAVSELVDRSRVALRRDRIDVLLVHHLPSLVAHGEALVELLQSCVDSGWVETIGVSVYDPADLPRLEGLGAVQFPHNPFDRRFVSSPSYPSSWRTFARSALLQGVFALEPSDLPPRVHHTKACLQRYRGACEGLGLSPVSAALRYAAASPADAVVLGVDTAEQLVEAAVHLGAPLDDHAVAAIDTAVGDVPPAVRDPRAWEAA